MTAVDGTVVILRLRGDLIELGPLQLDARTAAQLALDLFAVANQALEAEFVRAEARIRDLFTEEEGAHA